MIPQALDVQGGKAFRNYSALLPPLKPSGGTQHAQGTEKSRLLPPGRSEVTHNSMVYQLPRRSKQGSLLLSQHLIYRPQNGLPTTLYHQKC